MDHRQRPSVCEMNVERLKRTCLVQCSELFDSHNIGSTMESKAVQRRALLAALARPFTFPACRSLAAAASRS